MYDTCLSLKLQIVIKDSLSYTDIVKILKIIVTHYYIIALKSVKWRMYEKAEVITQWATLPAGVTMTVYAL